MKTNKNVFKEAKYCLTSKKFYCNGDWVARKWIELEFVDSERRNEVMTGTKSLFSNYLCEVNLYVEIPYLKSKTKRKV